jgi:hypothetical protein
MRPTFQKGAMVGTKTFAIIAAAIRSGTAEPASDRAVLACEA